MSYPTYHHNSTDMKSSISGKNLKVDEFRYDLESHASHSEDNRYIHIHHYFELEVELEILKLKLKLLEETTRTRVSGR